jgi:hypothetical protein
VLKLTTNDPIKWIIRHHHSDWLADLFGVERVVVQELEDGSVIVELDFYPSRPFVGKHRTLKFHISREAITQNGLFPNLLALAAHIRDVQRAYEQKERRFSSHGT